MNVSDIVFYILFIAVFGMAVFFVATRFSKDGVFGTSSAAGLSKRTVVIIMAAALVSRLVLLLVSWGAVHASGFGSPLAETWSRWDALQYLRIAGEGYFDAADGWIRIVFFPLYPSAVWALKLIVQDAHISGLLVSWLCLGVSCVYLYKLVLLDGDKKAAFRAVKYLLIFPVTVFLGAPFSESMFLMCSFACFYYARTGHFFRACLAGFLAALTRNVGVLLIVPVLIEMLGAHGLVPGRYKENAGESRKAFWKHAAWLPLIPLGTGLYLLMNQLMLGDALGFLQLQSAKWSQSFGSYAHSLSVTLGQLTGGGILRDKILLWGSQLVLLLTAGLTLPVICKKMRVSDGAYAIVYLFVIFAPTWLLSGFRYYMGLAVLFPALALLTRHRWADTALTVLCAVLMPVYTFAFSMGWLVF